MEMADNNHARGYNEQIDEEEIVHGSDKDYQNDSLVGSQMSRQARQYLAHFEQGRIIDEIDRNKYVP